MTSRSDRLRGWFPLPFVAIVVLLVVLILVTPNLVTSGTPSAGTLPTEAELLVDRTVAHNLTHFYVKAIGTVRYSSIHLAIGTNASPAGAFRPPPTPRSFNFTNATTWNDSIFALFATRINPVAVNVSALYVDANGMSVWFVGVFDFDVAADFLYYVSYLPSASPIRSTPLSALPLTLPLAVGP